VHRRIDLGNAGLGGTIHNQINQEAWLYVAIREDAGSRLIPRKAD
jgi:hypothetical protein